MFINLIKEFGEHLQGLLTNCTDMGDQLSIITDNFSSIPNNRRIELKYKGLKVNEYGSDTYNNDFPNTKDAIEVRLLLTMDLFDEGDTSELWQNGALYFLFYVRNLFLNSVIEFSSGGMKYRAKATLEKESGLVFDFENNTAAYVNDTYEVEIYFKYKRGNITQKVYDK